MKENLALPNTCESAAVRVQYWFGKDKENLLSLNRPSPKAQEFGKKHKCDLVKTPRTPSQIEHLPLQGYVLSKKKRSTKQRQVTHSSSSKAMRIRIDPSKCSINQRNNFNLISSDTPLSSGRVALYKQKEHLLVCKRLKILSKQKQTGPKRHDVVRIKSSTQKELVENPYLKDWANKEERLFQIDRVIKYLTH